MLMRIYVEYMDLVQSTEHNLALGKQYMRSDVSVAE